MNAHKQSNSIDDGAAARQAAWVEEWDKQFALLPQDRRDAITLDPTIAYADELDDLVEKILCERGEL